MNDWVMLLGGGVLLYFGAEWFVGGASALALALRIPQLIVGLTVVAYGTSAPEVIVGIEATRDGHGPVALGNVVGSNIANIGLILGTGALFKPARVDGALRRRELPVLLASTAVIPLLLLDGVVTRLEAGSLLAFALSYTAWMVKSARASMVAAARAEVRETAIDADIAGAPAQGGRWRAAATVVVGLLVLLVGGNLFVRGAVSVAHALGLSERIIGLTIVAVGTSLPELVTSLVAAKRGHSDIAVGNVVGSNIFNALLCLGSAGLFGAVGAPLASVGFDFAALSVMTLLAAILIRTQRTITRVEGGVALALYVAFVVITLGRS